MNHIIEKKEIELREHRLYQAILHADLDVLDNLLHDDLLFVIPDGSVITKKMDMDTYRDRKLVIQRLEPTIENISIIEDCAVVVATLQLQGTYDDAAFQSGYRYIRVWKKFGDAIMVIAGSGSPI